MLQKIASPRLEPVVFLEKTTDLPKWREAVTRVAEGALGPAWRTTIKVEGRLSAELEGLNPDHSAIKKMKAGMPPAQGRALPAPHFPHPLSQCPPPCSGLPIEGKRQPLPLPLLRVPVGSRFGPLTKNTKSTRPWMNISILRVLRLNRGKDRVMYWCLQRWTSISSGLKMSCKKLGTASSHSMCASVPRK